MIEKPIKVVASEDKKRIEIVDAHGGVLCEIVAEGGSEISDEDRSIMAEIAQAVNAQIP